MKILVADDEALLVKGIRFNLQSDGYEVVTGSNGVEAVQLAADPDVNLVILDVMMPEMDGLETLRRIRELYQTPVVLMTGDKTLDVSTGFSALGCDDYITKPLLPLLIREVVHNMTERTSIEG